MWWELQLFGEKRIKTTTPVTTPDDKSTAKEPGTSDEAVEQQYRDEPESDDEDPLLYEPTPLDLSGLNQPSGPSLAVDEDLVSTLLALGPLDFSPLETELADNLGRFTFSDPVEDELVSALGAVGIGEKETKENQPHLETVSGPSSSPLPDIEFDFGDDTFLDADQLNNVFDEQENTQREIVNEAPIGGPIHPVENSASAELVDQDTEQLYQELANLSLGPESHGNPVADDGLPAYLYCQPCTPNDSLLSPLPPNFPLNTEGTQSFSDWQLKQLQAEPPDELEDLLPFSFADLQGDQAVQEMEPAPQHYLIREEAHEAAFPLLRSFGLLGEGETEPKSKERSCFTHRETIFGVAFSDCGRFCATASQDSTIAIWNVSTNSLLTQLTEHSKDFECLRVAWASSAWSREKFDRRGAMGDKADSSDDTFILATSSADGTVRLWGCPDPIEKKDQWTCLYTLDHATLLPTTTSDPDKPQVYALQFIDHWKAFTTDQSSSAKNSFLMTSSDDLVHLWEVETRKPTQSIELVGDSLIRMRPDTVHLTEVMSIHFGAIESHGYGVTPCSVTGAGMNLPPVPTSSTSGETGFGGDRNPDNKVFVFDGSYCAANGLLGVALADGSLRLVNGRGVCVSVVNLPGCQSHLTSFSWDSTGRRLATSVATGHLISWALDLEDVDGSGNSTATCLAIMEGGHQVGRPLFGSRYCGRDENLIVSWGVDGNLCLWDSQSHGNVHAPIAILKCDPTYPIYAVELSKDTIAVGGGSEGGFVGVPLYMHTFDSNSENINSAVAPAKEEASKISDAQSADGPIPSKETNGDSEGATETKNPGQQ